MQSEEVGFQSAFERGTWILTQIQRGDQPESHQGFVLHDHVFAGRHGYQVLHPAALDDRPDDVLEQRVRGEERNGVAGHLRF